MPQIQDPPYRDTADSQRWHEWYRQINELLSRVSRTITSIDDVLITGVTDDELFSWDSASAKWINKTRAEASVQTAGDVLDDLNTTGAVGADSEFLVGTAAGALAWEDPATARTSLGLLGIGELVDDTTPQLGGDLDVNGKQIVSVSGTNIDLHSDNDVIVTLGDAGGIDDFIVQDSGDVTVFGVTSDGAVTLASTLDGRDVATDGTKLDGIESAADVTDTANVTAAGALMDSEVDADLKTFVLPASTTISAYGATLVDDANAAAARTTLELLGIGELVDDTTPQLGGDLDMNGKQLTPNVGIGIASSGAADALHIEASVSPALRLAESAETGTYTQFLDLGAGTSRWRVVHNDGPTIQDIDAAPDTGQAATVRMWRNTNTAGLVRQIFYRGDGTNTVDHEIRTGAGASSSFGLNGKVGIGTTGPSTRLHVTDSATSLITYDSTAANSTTAGPLITLRRNQLTTPQDNDSIGSIRFLGAHDGSGTSAAIYDYGNFRMRMLDVTEDAEASDMLWATSVAGAVATRMQLAGGLFLSGATGGDKGANTINASQYYLDGRKESGPTTAVPTTPYTVLFSDRYLLVDTSSAAITVNLEAAATAEDGRRLDIKVTDATNSVTVDGATTETIDGATTAVLTVLHESISLVCDGSNWHII